MASSTHAAFLFLQVSLLLWTSFLATGAASAPHHPHPPVKRPSYAPAPPPYAHPPAKPPTTPLPPPPLPPKYPPAKKLAVQGVVYCKSCKYKGYPSLVRATPLHGAVVKLECKFRRYSLVQFARTDKGGYFLFLVQKVYAAYSGKCRVVPVSSPLAKCNVPTILRGGRKGARLVPARNLRVPKFWPYMLFNVGPFAFDSRYKCH